MNDFLDKLSTVNPVWIAFAAAFIIWPFMEIFVNWQVRRDLRKLEHERRKYWPFIAIILLLASCGVASARLNDTPAQIEAALGAPVKSDGFNLRWYARGDYKVLVVFENRRSVLEVWSRKDGRDIEPAERTRIMVRNISSKSSAADPQVAKYDDGWKTLTITTRRHLLKIRPRSGSNHDHAF